MIHAPRQCDWTNLVIFARYLQGTRLYATRTQLNAESQGRSSVVTLDCYNDSDHAGCRRTRRSTTGEVAVVAGAVVESTSQTQPGLPALSVGEGETRATSHGCSTAMYLQKLVEEDFRMECTKPRLWTDSGSTKQGLERLGVGKIRHLETQHLFVQEAQRLKLMTLGKVKGTENPSNILTKHLKSGQEMRDALPGLDIVDLSEQGLKQLLDDAKELKVSGVSATASGKTGAAKRPTPWKCPLPNRITAGSVIMLGCLLGAATGERAEKETVENADWNCFWFICLYVVMHLVHDTIVVGKVLYSRVTAGDTPEATEAKPTQAKAPQRSHTATVIVPATPGSKAHLRQDCVYLNVHPGTLARAKRLNVCMNCTQLGFKTGTE